MLNDCMVSFELNLDLDYAVMFSGFYLMMTKLILSQFHVQIY